MDRDYKKWASGLIKGKVLFDAPMRQFTSMKVGGSADSLFFPRNVDELKKVVRYSRRKKIPLLVLGKGTNLVVRDKGVRGWVVNLTQGMKKIRMDGKIVEADSGLPLQRLVHFSIQKGLTGLEPFFGIPGTVGGGLAMNAGAWGVELKDVFLSMTFMKEDGELGEQSSAGSIFKNPKEGPAGKWIEAAGLKGLRMERAMVSDRHANFIINLGKATAEEVIHLMEGVERKVYEEKGISLEREVR